MQVNEFRVIQFPPMIDADLEDTASLVTCDFGLASSFIQGKFPSFKVLPNSNTSDPGVYEVKTVITDDNLNKK
jgi:hypothetical protein